MVHTKRVCTSNDERNARCNLPRSQTIITPSNDTREKENENEMGNTDAIRRHTKENGTRKYTHENKVQVRTLCRMALP